MNPKQKTEQALQAFLESFEDDDAVTIPIYKGIENTKETDVEAESQTREVPCVTVANRQTRTARTSPRYDESRISSALFAVTVR